MHLVRTLRREEPPSVAAAAVRIAHYPGTHDRRRRPAFGLFSGKRRAVDLALRARAISPARASIREARVPKPSDLPHGLSRRQLRVIRACGPEDEAAAPGQLRDRRMVAELPAYRLQHMPSARKARDLVALVVPVMDDPAVRSARDRPPVEQEDETLVCADVYRKRGAVRLELAPEAVEPAARRRQGVRPGVGGHSRLAPNILAVHPYPGRGVNRLQRLDVRRARLHPLRTEHLNGQRLRRTQAPQHRKREEREQNEGPSHFFPPHLSRMRLGPLQPSAAATSDGVYPGST